MLALASVGACGPRIDPAEGGAAGTGSTGDAATHDAAGSTSSAGPTTTSGSSGSGETTTGSETSDSSTSTGDALPESVCDPQPESIVAAVVVDEIEYQWDHDEVDRTLTCTVNDVTGDVEAGARIVLDCTNERGVAETHTLDVTVEPVLELPIAEGSAVQFRMITFIPWWGDLYVTLRDDAGELLLAYLSAGRPFDGCCGVEPDPSVFDPIAFTVAGDACELDCEDAGSGFIVDPCPCTQRRAFEFVTPDGTARVYDRGSGSLDAYAFRVPTAYGVYGPGGEYCSGVVDSPLGWHTALAVRRP